MERGRGRAGGGEEEQYSQVDGVRYGRARRRPRCWSRGFSHRAEPTTGLVCSERTLLHTWKLSPQVWKQLHMVYGSSVKPMVVPSVSDPLAQGQPLITTHASGVGGAPPVRRWISNNACLPQRGRRVTVCERRADPPLSERLVGADRDSARATGRRPRGRPRRASRLQLQAAGPPLQAAERVAVRSGLVGDQNATKRASREMRTDLGRARRGGGGEGGWTASSVHSTSVAPAHLTLVGEREPRRCRPLRGVALNSGGGAGGVVGACAPARPPGISPKKRR